MCEHHWIYCSIYMPYVCTENSLGMWFDAYRCAECTMVKPFRNEVRTEVFEFIEWLNQDK